jgi:hypothetical protein
MKSTLWDGKQTNGSNDNPLNSLSLSENYSRTDHTETSNSSPPDIRRLASSFLYFINRYNKKKANIKVSKARHKRQDIEAFARQKKHFKVSDMALGNSNNSSNCEKSSRTEKHSSNSLTFKKIENYAQNSESQDYKKWDMPQLIKHIEYCRENNFLTNEQICILIEWIKQKESKTLLNCHTENQKSANMNFLDKENYPLNCMHVRTCYIIREKQGKGSIDPTEIGRKYKNLYLAVILKEEVRNGAIRDGEPGRA